MTRAQEIKGFAPAADGPKWDPCTSEYSGPSVLVVSGVLVVSSVLVRSKASLSNARSELANEARCAPSN